jgi:hypothetical protein
VDPKTLLSVILKLPGLVPVIDDRIARMRGKLTKSDRTNLLRYVRRLDERRVFFHPYGVEVVEVCVGSLDQVKELTDEIRAAVEHEGARAALGAILDATRTFLDTWKGFRTPRDTPWEQDAFTSRSRPQETAPERSLERFFEDLGELRGVVKLMLALLQEIDPKLAAPNLSSPAIP